MVQAMININEHSNRVLNIVKAKFGLKDKSQAIDLVVKDYEESFLEPGLRPEYKAKLEKIMKGKHLSQKEFEKRLPADADITEVKNYAKNYFEVFMDVEDLNASLA